MTWKILPDTYIGFEYENNKRSIHSIAKELRVSDSTISRHLSINNIELRGSNITHAKRTNAFCKTITGEGNHQFGLKNNKSAGWRTLPDEEIADMYLRGKSTTSIACEYNCDQSTISRHLKNFGIILRSHSESNSGSKNGRWNNGASFEPYCPKFNYVLKESVRVKYNRICQKCYKPENGRKLDVHHINFDKQAGCYGKSWNLIPLHHDCHTWTTNHRFEAFQLFCNHWAMNEEISFFPWS